MFVTLHYIYYLCHLYYMVFFSLDLWHGSFGFCNKKVIAKKGFAILVPAELRGRQRGQLWRVLLHRHKFGRLEGLLQGRLLLQFRLKTFFRKPLSLFLHFVFSMAVDWNIKFANDWIRTADLHQLHLRNHLCEKGWKTFNWSSGWKPFLENMGHFLPLFLDFRLFNAADSVGRYMKFANDWIRTMDLWSQKQLFYQLSHNYYPTVWKTFTPSSGWAKYRSLSIMINFWHTKYHFFKIVWLNKNHDYTKTQKFSSQSF